MAAIRNTKTGEFVSLTREKPPRYKSCFGRTWDYSYITIDGNEVQCWQDFTWGSRLHFEYNGAFWNAPEDEVDYHIWTWYDRKPRNSAE